MLIGKPPSRTTTKQWPAPRDSAVRVARAALASFDGAPADQSHIAHYLEAVNGVALGSTDKKDPS